MENIEQVKRGICNYIDAEVVPIVGGWKGVALGVGAALVVENKSDELVKNPFVQMMGVIDGNQIDVDKLYTKIKLKAQGKWPMDIAGFKASESDLDKLYQFIKKG